MNSVCNGTGVPFLRVGRALSGSLLLLALLGCGEKKADAPATGDTAEVKKAPAAEALKAATGPAELADELPNGLLFAYAQFIVEDGKVTAKPGPAKLEIVYRQGGEWKTKSFTDEESNVFHKALAITPTGGKPAILTVGGMDAIVKLWRPEGDSFTSTTLWKESFGGKFNRMRDVEVADLNGDGNLDLAVATHDQGVMAMLYGKADGTFEVEKIDRKKDTFVHEVEIGDVNHDGALEVYATPSDPNRLDGSEQHGEVVRYVPKTGEGRTVVADLGNRHAKEIYVGDVDGDGKDELYVAVEALTEGKGAGVKVVEGVEIRRYEADTPKDQGVVIAKFDDRLTRFLTVGDVDGDGKKEMVAAGFRSGLWLLRPGSDANGEWGIENIDRDSSGFEHASLFTDLDGDGFSELYVGADEQGEVRRYVWRNGRPRREVIHSRELANSMMTWNIMPVALKDIGL